MLTPFVRATILFAVVLTTGCGVFRSTPQLDPEAELRLSRQLEYFFPGNMVSQQAARDYAQQQLRAAFSRLENEGLRRKPSAKSLEIIRDYVRQHFLRGYRDYASFADLFRHGHYDRATATAIYALFLDYFDLPHKIEADLWEVVPIVEVDGTRTALVAPVRRLRVEAREQGFVRNYLSLLRAVDLLPPEAWTQPEAEIFERYYLPRKMEMTLPQLASFLHYLQALRAYRDQQYLETINQLDFAQGLASLPVYAILRRATSLQLANKGQSESRESLFHLFKLWEQTPTELFEVELINRFSRATDDYLFQRRQPAELDSLYQYFKSHTTQDPRLHEQLQDIYYLKRARYHAMMREPSRVMTYMDSLYQIRPDDTNVHNVLAGFLVWSLRSEHNYAAGLDLVDEYREKYPFLVQHPYFKDLDLSFRAERIRYFFDNDQPNEGHRYLNEFESLLAVYGRTPRSDSWITTAYLAASGYYYRRKEYASALQWIERGYALAPTDPYLDHRTWLLRMYR